ncbi:MAG: 4-demethylwyosine synthase TYW1 [Nanoarchaeota archaeon]
MLTEILKKRLEKQHYKIVGSHSAVKTCEWTKKMIRGQGGCYKLKFYGIQSNQCMQMTTSISCANRCDYCWRDLKAPVAKEWRWLSDTPEDIFSQSILSHHKLLTGFKGSKKTNLASYELSKTIRHVALSLTGEPIIYPRINELIKIFDKNKISTFLVTHGQYPEAIKALAPVTQLYLSINSTTPEMYKIIDRPLFPDYWEKQEESLAFFAEKKQRKCIRLTAIKGFNMIAPEKHAALLLKASPDFIEVKAYMHIGASAYRLKRECMPSHAEVADFAIKLAKHLKDYEVVAEHIPSQVVLIAHKKFLRNKAWYTWIDFDKYHKLVLSGKEFSTEDYLKQTPAVGISGETMKEVEKLN